MAIMQMDMALFNAYISLVKVLHKNKALHIDEVVAEIGETIDFRRKHHLETADDHLLLTEIHDALVKLGHEIVEAEGRRGQ
jgi:translation elongation factor EF-Ts